MESEQKPSHLGEALEELLEQRDKLDSAIEAIRELLKLRGGSAAVGAHLPKRLNDNARASVEVGIPSDAFFGMTIPDAVRKYLGIVKRPQSPRQIAMALENGGLHHTSQNFPNTVRSIMSRVDKAGGDIVRAGKGWGLVEWYPGKARAKRGRNGTATSEGRREETTEDADDVRRDDSDEH